MWFLMRTMERNRQAVKNIESQLNELLSMDKKHHYATLTITNPDGEKIRLKQGFKIELMEMAFNIEGLEEAIENL